MRRLYLFKVLPYAQSRRWLRHCGLLFFWTAIATIFNIVMVGIVVVVQENRCLQGAESQWASEVCNSAGTEALASLGATLATMAVLMIPAAIALFCAAIVVPKLPFAFFSPRVVWAAFLLYSVCIATLCTVVFMWTTLWR